MKNTKSRLMLPLVAGGGLLLLLVGGAAFIWPGFLLPAAGDEEGEPRESALAPASLLFLPADSNLIVGIALEGPGKSFAVTAMRRHANSMGLPTLEKEFLDEVEYVIMAGDAMASTWDRGMLDMTPEFKGNVVLQTRKPQKSEKVLKLFGAGNPEKLREKTIYRCPYGILHLADDRRIVLSKMPTEQFGNLLEVNTPVVSKDILEQVKKLAGNSLWLLFSMDGEPRRVIKEIDLNRKENFQTEGIFDFVVMLREAKFVSVKANLAADARTMKFDVRFQSAQDAQLKKAEAGIKANMKFMLQLQTILDRELVDDLFDTVQFKLGNHGLTGSATISEAALKKVAVRWDLIGQRRPRNPVVKSLREIMVAMHTFHDDFGGLPPAAICSKTDGKTLLSWRVALLPYIGCRDLYKKFKLDEPWDGPNNIKLLAEMPNLYLPSGVSPREPHTTHYQLIVGANTAFELVLDRNYLFGARGLNLNSGFPRGTSFTMALVEAPQAVPWTKPADLLYEAGKPLPKLAGLDKDGFYAAFIDADVHFMPVDFAEPDLRNLMTRINDGPPVRNLPPSLRVK